MFKKSVAAVSIGMPRKVEIHGHSVTTGIVKNSVNKPVYISKTGLSGDKSAVHPDAVYSFAYENYDYWAKQLQLTTPNWDYGHFGENLSLLGIKEASLRIGDIIRVGKDVQLQVLGPRVPCFKLAWRLGQPESFLKEFALSGRTGFYSKVIQEGYIQSGDDIEIIPNDINRYTVSQIANLIWQDEAPSEQDLIDALSINELSETSASPLRNKLARIQDQNRTTTGRWEGWKECSVQKVIEEADGIRSYILCAVDGTELAGYRPGQFIVIKINTDDGQELVRTYSLSDFSDDLSRYRISIKRHESGSGSSLIHSFLEVGASIEIQAPVGRFVLDRTGLEPVVCIAAGVGVTPLLAMAKAHLGRGSSAPIMYFINCVKGSGSSAFMSELLELEASSDKFKLITFHSQPLNSDKIGVDFDHKGRLTIEILKEVLKNTFVDYCGTLISVPWTTAKFYVCGPQQFQDEVTGWLKDNGVHNNHIDYESFTPLYGNPMGNVVVAAEVIFSKSKRTVLWESKTGETLLELAEKHGIESSSSCKIGVCKTCECELLEGEVHYDFSPASFPAEGKILLCCAKPGSRRLIVGI
jgi:uncharacterized protein